MKEVGWFLIVFGALAFIGAVSKGNTVFGPLFWIGIGGLLIYLKKEREENDKEKSASVSVPPQKTEIPNMKENKNDKVNNNQSVPVTFEQKEAALCLIAFFAGYNDDITANDAAYMLSYQSATFFNIEKYKEALTAALPKYQDADKLLDTVLTIKDRRSKEFILLTCYDLTKMSGKAEAYEFLYNIANDMGYDRERLKRLIDQYSDRQILS